MGLFDRFKRNRKKTVLPTEVDEYYKSEMRTRRGTSILFALFALVVTLVIAAGLFFGGRAIHRALTDDNKDQSQVDQNNDTSDEKNQAQSSPSAESGNSAPTPGPSEGSSSSESGSSSSDSSSSSSESSSSNATSTSTPSSVPATGDEPQALPHTGD